MFKWFQDIFSSLTTIDYEIILENTRNSKISLLHNIRHLECSNTLDSDLQHTDRAFQNRKIPMLQRRFSYKYRIYSFERRGAL